MMWAIVEKKDKDLYVIQSASGQYRQILSKPNLIQKMEEHQIELSNGFLRHKKDNVEIVMHEVKSKRDYVYLFRTALECASATNRPKLTIKSKVSPRFINVNVMQGNKPKKISVDMYYILKDDEIIIFSPLKIILDKNTDFSDLPFVELDLKELDVSNRTDFYEMFDYCDKLQTVDIKGWGDLTAYYNSMFYSCDGLRHIKDDAYYEREACRDTK